MPTGSAAPPPPPGTHEVNRLRPTLDSSGGIAIGMGAGIDTDRAGCQPMVREDVLNKERLRSAPRLLVGFIPMALCGDLYGILDSQRSEDTRASERRL